MAGVEAFDCDGGEKLIRGSAANDHYIEMDLAASLLGQGDLGLEAGQGGLCITCTNTQYSLARLLLLASSLLCEWLDWHFLQ